MLTRELIADKYLLMPDTEAVSYKPLVTSAQGGESYPTTISVGNARPRSVTLQLLAALNLPAATTTKQFDIWQQQLGEVTPKQSDKIIDASGATWMVKDVRNNLLEQVWYLICVKVRS